MDQHIKTLAESPQGAVYQCKSERMLAINWGKITLDFTEREFSSFAAMVRQASTDQQSPEPSQDKVVAFRHPDRPF